MDDAKIYIRKEKFMKEEEIITSSFGSSDILVRKSAAEMFFIGIPFQKINEIHKNYKEFILYRLGAKSICNRFK